MFHEFGHALHGMFSRVRYPRFSGTSVPAILSNFLAVNEMWAVWPEVLKNYANTIRRANRCRPSCSIRCWRPEIQPRLHDHRSTSPPPCSTWPGTS